MFRSGPMSLCPWKMGREGLLMSSYNSPRARGCPVPSSSCLYLHKGAWLRTASQATGST